MLIKKLSCRHSVNTAIPRSDNTAIRQYQQCVLSRQYIQYQIKRRQRANNDKNSREAKRWLQDGSKDELAPCLTAIPKRKSKLKVGFEDVLPIS